MAPHLRRGSEDMFFRAFFFLEFPNGFRLPDKGCPGEARARKVIMM